MIKKTLIIFTVLPYFVFAQETPKRTGTIKVVKTIERPYLFLEESAEYIVYDPSKLDDRVRIKNSMMFNKEFSFENYVEYDEVTQIPPQFVDGKNELQILFNKHFNHSIIPANYPLNDPVIIELTINPSGKIINKFLFKGIQKDIDNECIRIISLAENWIPGKEIKRNRFVTTQRNSYRPTRFRLLCSKLGIVNETSVKWKNVTSNYYIYIFLSPDKDKPYHHPEIFNRRLVAY